MFIKINHLKTKDALLTKEPLMLSKKANIFTRKQTWVNNYKLLIGLHILFFCFFFVFFTKYTFKK